MAVKIVKKPVAAVVEVEKNKTRVRREHVPVSVADDSKPMANVGFSAAYTKNLGDYESLKISVSLHMPVAVSGDPADPTTLQALNNVFSNVQYWVDKKISEVLDELNE